MTLTVYVEWVAVQYIFAEDGKLLHSLCFLLSEDSVKKEAAECLLQVWMSFWSKNYHLALLSVSSIMFNQLLLIRKELFYYHI